VGYHTLDRFTFHLTHFEGSLLQHRPIALVRPATLLYHSTCTHLVLCPHVYYTSLHSPLPCGVYHRVDTTLTSRTVVNSLQTPQWTVGQYPPVCLQMVCRSPVHPGFLSPTPCCCPNARLLTTRADIALSLHNCIPRLHTRPIASVSSCIDVEQRHATGSQ
jgi:hypothetical protein